MPKRSTGCDLCRKRKVRCDEAKPQCQRCKAFGAECPGYSGAQRVVFKDQTSSTAQKSQRKAKSKQTDPEETDDSFSNFYLEDEVASSDQASSSGAPSRRASSQQSSSRRSSVQHQENLSRRGSIQRFESSAAQSSSLAGSSSQAGGTMLPARAATPFDIDTKTATRAAIQATFLESFLPSKADIKGEENSQYLYIRMLPDANPNHAALRSAVETLSLVHIATLKEDKNLLYESRHSYGKALSTLYQALSQPKTQMEDETLAAISILAICDFYHATSQTGSGWISHVTGGRGLLANRGPQSIKSNLAWRIFLNSRFQSCNGGILMRKSIYFDRPEWLELTAESAKHNYFIALTDVMVKVPTLLEDMDKVLDSSEVFNIENVSGVLTRYRELLRDLESWYSNLIAREGELIAQSTDVYSLSDFLELSPDPPFSTAYYFSTVQYGIMIAFYHFSKYILCKNTADVVELLHSLADAQSLAQHLPNIPSLKILHHQAHTHISSLIRCIPFLCTGPCAVIGRLQVLLFLWFSQDYFGSRSEPTQSSAWSNVHQDFQTTHVWCWKMYAALYKTGVVPPKINLPPRSNMGGRVQIFSIKEEEDDVGMAIDRVRDNSGLDFDSMIPPPPFSVDIPDFDINSLVTPTDPSAPTTWPGDFSTIVAFEDPTWSDTLTVRDSPENPR